MLGFRNDVPELMMSSDVLMWPSLESPREGLGLGIVEAQAAGLPILMSRSVPDEAIIVPELVRVLPLAAGAGKWAEGVNELLQRSRLNRHEALARVEASSFSMAAGVSNFMALYQGLKQAAAERAKA
jgi:glycosyltransferase involved in cell wall biosynthesis